MKLSNCDLAELWNALAFEYEQRGDEIPDTIRTLYACFRTVLQQEILKIRAETQP